MIITIDGPAGSGKSTVSKILAEKLNFIHFNSGALFRGITAFLYKNKYDIESISSTSSLPKIEIKSKMIKNSQHVIVNGKDYTSILRDNIISTLVPHVALNKHCRTLVDNCQRAFATKHNIVVEGRDIGSHVFPNAEFKFYLDCSIKERAKRRFNEEQAKNSSITLKEIEQQIKERDMLDKTRDLAPLVVPKNAIIIDSTSLTIDEVVDKMLKSIKS